MKRYNTWADLIAQGQGGLPDEYLRLDEEMAKDPWKFVTAVDPLTKRSLIWTRDESHPDGFRPFPKKRYLERFYEVMHNEQWVFVEKSRQMIVSTACCLYICWDCIYHNARRWLVSRSKEEDAIELLRDKIRAPWGQMPEWYQQLHPLSQAPLKMIRVTPTESYIQAVTENVANRTARGGTATGLLLDEAAFQDAAREIYTAAAPMAQKIFVVTTPSLGLGGAFVRAKIEEAQRGSKAPEYDL